MLIHQPADCLRAAEPVGIAAQTIERGLYRKLVDFHSMRDVGDPWFDHMRGMGRSALIQSNA